MIAWLVLILLILGAGFSLVAAIGVLRFNDLYMRMHAATKAGAFGGSLIALACGFWFGSISAWVQVLMVILFFYLTAPVAAHMLARQRFHRDQIEKGQSDKGDPGDSITG
jgi:multicomponent Na+:H+ antiporter subunit G